jgi:hypothetical protein
MLADLLTPAFLQWQPHGHPQRTFAHRVEACGGLDLLIQLQEHKATEVSEKAHRVVSLIEAEEVLTQPGDTATQQFSFQPAQNPTQFTF